MSFQPEPQSYREYALDALERLRTAITDENVDEAVEQMRSLRSLVKDWQRTTAVRKARLWLDESLRNDLLLFNAEEARRHLERWKDSLSPDGDDFEYKRYETLVDDRAEQKSTALLVHGVTSHCETLFTRAAELERSETPTRPDFMLSNYYGKAHAIARAAVAEHEGNPELTILLQRAEKLLNDKQTASKIYPSALESEQYADALRDLNRVPTDMLVPRYTSDGSAAGRNYMVFSGMTSVVEARRELEGLAQGWAGGKATSIIDTATRQLDEHDPQAALDTLGGREPLEQFLSIETRTVLDGLRTRAQGDLRNKQRAEQLAIQATQTIDINPIDSWNIYAEAYRTFQWTPALNELRENVVKAMVTQLERLVGRAEGAFNNREMEHVRQISGSAKRIYSAKDGALDTLLDRMTEMEEMTRQYEDYLQSASDLFSQVKVLLREDAVAANDLLTQLESYPDIVLEAFPDLHEYRNRVNRQLNADQVYNSLYPQVYMPDLASVERSVEAAEGAADDYNDDNRFPTLVRLLRFHRDFLLAQEHYSNGQVEKALFLIEPIATGGNHPDRDAARRLRDSWQSASTE
jgi:hypothetical protein